ncbi:MAG: AAA family ATPase [Ilumatobacteraceae bacterium]
MQAIVRDRVDRLLDRAWDVPYTMVVGPAGAGKTTAVGHLVRRSGDQAVWYRAHPVDGDERRFAEHLGQAVARATGRTHVDADLSALAVDVEDAGARLLVVIDEFDAIIGTASERAFGDLLVDLPASVHVVSLSRHRPAVNSSRLRLGPGIAEIGPDDLRFRSWEVERLFRDLYRRPLLPDEVAELERRTGGWVAALQLFNLATTRLAAAERHAAISLVGRRSGPDWDFLADNVLSALPDELQLFLLETAPLVRLTAALCDDLLGAGGSARTLAELERLQLVTPSLDDAGTFRSHEVLRAHLDGQLMEWEGADAVRKRYRRAADVLERHGHVPDALMASCRGEDWSSASRLVGAHGAEVADLPGRWLSGLPQEMVRNDPWLLLADARRHRADGRLAAAIDRYHEVEAVALTAVAVTIARRERLLLTSLIDRSSFPSLGWVAVIREAVVGDPLLAAAQATTQTAADVLAGGVAHLLAGDVDSARPALRRARDRADASPTVAVGAQLGLVIAEFLAGDGDAISADEVERAASALDVPFLARLCRATCGMVTGSRELIASTVAECEANGDTIGAAVTAVLGAIAIGWGPGPRPAPPPTDAIARCRAERLTTLEVWTHVASALAATGRAEGVVLADVAVMAARRRGLRSLHEVVDAAGAAAARGSVGDPNGPSRTSTGLAVPEPVDDAATPRAPTRAGVEGLRFRCLGQFDARRAGVALELDDLRPRARTVLRMLAVHLGTGVHRHVLGEELWPADDEQGAARKLQVAISSIRRVLDQDGSPPAVRRRGDVYLLDAEAGASADVHDFARAVADARALVARGMLDDAEAPLRRAVELYRGELLPEEGAADWVIRLRDQHQAAATDAAQLLGRLMLDAARPADAVEVCRWGLTIDRYCDPLWRLLVGGLDAQGDLAGRARADAQYDEVLAELGVHRDA